MSLFLWEKSTTILEEKRAIFIPTSEFVCVHVSLSTWFDFCCELWCWLPDIKTLGIILGVVLS